MKNSILLALVFMVSNLFAQNKRMESCDYQNPAIVNLTKNVVKNNIYFGKVCDIYDYCKSKWKLTDKPSNRKASEIVQTMSGDYDDFAVVVYSMIMASGGKSNEVGIFDAGTHLYTEVSLGKLQLSDVKEYDYVNTTIENRYKSPYWMCGSRDSNMNFWINLDWFTTHPAGYNPKLKDYASAPVYPK